MIGSTSRPALVLAGLLVSLATGAVLAADDGTTALHGFSADGASRQLALEQRFDALLDPADQREWMREMASAPNHLGSPHDKANAEFMLAKFREWGWDARIERFDVLYPTPKRVSLELLGRGGYKAKLREPAVKGDASSALAGGLPPYNVYGGDGDVTAELVYANYGMPDDYEELARRGVDVRGKIVITRYGAGWRGLKPKLAQQHGAVGCLIYSDPRDDGYSVGDTYPKGGWRPADGVQRGSVADMQVYPGDPLTPGIGSTTDAKRLALADAKTILKIPVLPISYADATPLLKSLEGQVAPPSWRGALPITYHVGPSTAKARMVVESDWTQKPVYDVVAVMRGAEEPDRWIVRGNHHDGWMFGAWDPLAGNVAMLAEAKAIGALARQGWQPKRTLVYASWDGEEPGLLGSTEWAETHARELQEKAVAYVNSDTNGRGFLGASGSHSLQHLVNQAAAAVQDPQTQASVLERMRAKVLVDGLRDGARADEKADAEIAAKGGDLPIGALGSGSDYSAFLEHLGIASLDLGFGGEDDQGGVYHSRYDTFEHYERFGDPGFAYGVALSKVAGRVVLRMADAELLPMRFGDFSDTFGRYVDELHKLVDDTREATARQHRLLDAGAWALVSDPTRAVGAPARDSDVPKIDLSPLDRAAKRLARSAQAFDRAYAAQAARGVDLPGERRAEANALMGRMEQALTDPHGLPDRDWFRHMVYAPGMLTGYGVKTVPGVREAIEARRWEEADRYAVETARVLDGYSAQLDALAKLLRP
ncbi:MAG TPA: M28 family metallopeptidase [Luteimonas sp.]|nr:M28 family metallopeptidase [Luteimonas sp.]